MDTLPLKMLEEVARRQNLPLAAGTVDPALLGGRPRLGAVLDRLRAGAPAPAMAFGPYRFYPAEGFLESDAGQKRLTEKERDILLALLAAGGGVVGRRVLLDAVWGYAGGVETHTLETHIYRLRQKIEADPANPVLLLTAEDGYSLAPELLTGG